MFDLVGVSRLNRAARKKILSAAFSPWDDLILTFDSIGTLDSRKQVQRSPTNGETLGRRIFMLLQGPSYT